MPTPTRQVFSAPHSAVPAAKSAVREFRAFQKKLILRKYGNYRSAAENLCTEPKPPLTMEELVERRTRQLEHYLNDPEDGDPRTSFAKAVEELTDCSLPSEDYGWDASNP